MPSAAICYSNYTVRVAQTFSVIEDYNKDSGSLLNIVMTFALEWTKINNKMCKLDILCDGPMLLLCCVNAVYLLKLQKSGLF